MPSLASQKTRPETGPPKSLCNLALPRGRQSSAVHVSLSSYRPNCQRADRHQACLSGSVKLPSIQQSRIIDQSDQRCPIMVWILEYLALYPLRTSPPRPPHLTHRTRSVNTRSHLFREERAGTNRSGATEVSVSASSDALYKQHSGKCNVKFPKIFRSGENLGKDLGTALPSTRCVGLAPAASRKSNLRASLIKHTTRLAMQSRLERSKQI